MTILVTLRDFYGEPMVTFVGVAAEHSTLTTWGREGEKEAIRSDFPLRQCFGSGSRIRMIKK